MSDRQCPLDGAGLAPGAEICPGCLAALRGRLRDVPGLLVELDVTLSRGASWTDAAGGGCCPDDCTHHPDDPRCTRGVRLDMDQRASEASLALRTCLHGWIRVWDEETPGVSPERDRALSTTAGQAGLLAGVTDLGARPWASDLATELRDATREAWRAMDRPPETRFAGWCPGRDGTCGRAIYGVETSAIARCRGCGATWDVEESRLVLLAALDELADRRLTKRELAVLTSTPVGTLHRWSSERRIIAAATNARGQPLYRAGPIIDAVLRGVPPERQS